MWALSGGDSTTAAVGVRKVKTTVSSTNCLILLWATRHEEVLEGGDNNSEGCKTCTESRKPVGFVVIAAHLFLAVRRDKSIYPSMGTSIYGAFMRSISADTCSRAIPEGRVDAFVEIRVVNGKRVRCVDMLGACYVMMCILSRVIGFKFLHVQIHPGLPMSNARLLFARPLGGLSGIPSSVLHGRSSYSVSSLGDKNTFSHKH